MFTRDRRRSAAEARRNARRSRPTLDSLERREVFTAGLAAPFVGPMPLAQPAAFVAQGPAPSSPFVGPMAPRFGSFAVNGHSQPAPHTSPFVGPLPLVEPAGVASPGANDVHAARGFYGTRHTSPFQFKNLTGSDLHHVQIKHT